MIAPEYYLNKWTLLQDVLGNLINVLMIEIFQKNYLNNLIELDLKWTLLQGVLGNLINILMIKYFQKNYRDNLTELDLESLNS